MLARFHRAYHILLQVSNRLCGLIPEPVPELLLSMEPWAPVRVPSQRPLAPSVASATSVANDKGDNEMILGAMHSSPGICLTAEENPRKPQPGDRLMKGLCGQSSPQMGLLSSKGGRWDRTARQEGRRKDIRKEQEIDVSIIFMIIGLGVSMSDYWSWGRGFDPRHFHKF